MTGVDASIYHVRYDPFDMGTAYAYVKGQWIRCISQYYKSFQNRSEREVKLATLELRRRRQKFSQRTYITAKEKATYLEEAEELETVLEQRLHDLAGLDVRLMIEVGTTSSKGEKEKKSLLKKPKKAKPRKNHRSSSSPEKIDLTKIEPYQNQELW